MSGRALTYLTDFFGTDSDAEVRKSTLQTPYRESIGSAFGRLGFHPMVAHFAFSNDAFPAVAIYISMKIDNMYRARRGISCLLHARQAFTTPTTSSLRCSTNRHRLQ